MEKTKDGYTEERIPGTGEMDRLWTSTFWESFSDCVIEMDAQCTITHIIKKPNSAFGMSGIVGKSFWDIADDRDRALAQGEMERFKSSNDLHKRFSFFNKEHKRFRWTLAATRENGELRCIHGV